MKRNKYIPLFSSQCFWDMDYKKLDFENDKIFVIERVLVRGSSRDEIELFKFYGWDTIKEEVVKIPYLNDKILNYLINLLEIDKELFRAYKNRGIY